MTALPTQPDRVATANQEELADEATKRQFESLISAGRWAAPIKSPSKPNNTQPGQDIS
jgi:hypothetical protein